jgi:hypothetical protein
MSMKSVAKRFLSPVSISCLAFLLHCGAADEAREDTASEQQAILDGTPFTGNANGAVAQYVGADFNCSGVLYPGGRWVITANHCVQGKDVTQMFFTTVLNPGPTKPNPVSLPMVSVAPDTPLSAWIVATAAQ